MARDPKGGHAFRFAHPVPWYALSALIIPAALGYAFGGVRTMIGCVLFSGLFRSYLMTMATSLVNSVCHSDGRWGYRRFELDDGTTNELATTILTFGEGLHNNHHRFPRDAYLSHAWYEIDINGLIILGLGKLGLVHDIFSTQSRTPGHAWVNDETGAPVEAFSEWRHIGRMSQSAFENLTAAVTTINTPMPASIDEGTLLACLKGDISEQKWRVYVQALFDEVDVSVIHNLVLDRIVTFDELLKAIDAWQVTESENERWVREMASFEVGRSPAEGAGRTR